MNFEREKIPLNDYLSAPNNKCAYYALIVFITYYLQWEENSQEIIKMLPTKWRLHVAKHCAVWERVAAHAQILPDHLLWRAVRYSTIRLELAASHLVLDIWHDVGTAYIHAVEDCQLVVVCGHCECGVSCAQRSATIDTRHK